MELAVDRAAAVPLGSQLAWQIQALIAEERLEAGERLPSVRGLALSAGVNVNTVRAVYERLEREGFVSSEHGRGTFVSHTAPPPRPEALRLYGRAAAGEGPPTSARPRARRGLTAEELAALRDDLVARLEQLDSMRDELAGVLESVRLALAAGEGPAGPDPAPAKPVLRRPGQIV